MPYPDAPPQEDRWTEDAWLERARARDPAWVERMQGNGRLAHLMAMLRGRMYPQMPAANPLAGQISAQSMVNPNPSVTPPPLIGVRQ